MPTATRLLGRRSPALVVAAGLALAGGCSPKYGGRHYDVAITTSPPNATLYVMEYDQFLRAGGDDAFDPSRRPWSDWRLPSTSPTTISREALLFICIATASADGKSYQGRTRAPFTPGRDKSVDVTLEGR